MIVRGHYFFLGVFLSAQYSTTMTVAADTGPTEAKSGSGGPPDTVLVVPYQKRPPPSHEIKLRDGRTVFVIDLEVTETDFVVRTPEGETLTLERSQVLSAQRVPAMR